MIFTVALKEHEAEPQPIPPSENAILAAIKLGGGVGAKIRSTVNKSLIKLKRLINLA